MVQEAIIELIDKWKRKIIDEHLCEYYQRLTYKNSRNTKDETSP
jgi:hypothetical protein